MNTILKPEQIKLVDDNVRITLNIFGKYDFDSGFKTVPEEEARRDEYRELIYNSTGSEIIAIAHQVIKSVKHYVPSDSPYLASEIVNYLRDTLTMRETSAYIEKYQHFRPRDPKEIITYTSEQEMEIIKLLRSVQYDLHPSSYHEVESTIAHITGKRIHDPFFDERLKQATVEGSGEKKKNPKTGLTEYSPIQYKD